MAFGLNRPIAITGLPDGRMLIAEKDGTVRSYHPDTGLAAEPVLDLTARIDPSDNERGLLGITPAPNFARTGMLYVAYTSLPAGALTLARVSLNAPDRVQVLLTQEHAEFGNHNGGQVAFGRDGYLYWSLGDGGNANDPFKSGQNLGTLLGKIVRIDVNRSCGESRTACPTTTRSSARRARGRRSGSTGCATRGSSPSTRPTTRCGSVTSARV
ncbi:PQQ-dependent sugar dehydrogenase [Micromonospora sp. M12]